VRGLGNVAFAIIAWASACAPKVDGPVEQQRAADREDAIALGAQLATLPGAVSATATIHRPARDPLALGAPSPASVAVLVVVDDATDRVATTSAANTLVKAAVPEVTTPAVVVMVGAHRAELAKVGPFVVDKSSAGALKAVLAVALALIAGLAGWIALRERRRA
jgi:type III secretory pathway lipoprotein EscJ